MIFGRPERPVDNAAIDCERDLLFLAWCRMASRDELETYVTKADGPGWKHEAAQRALRRLG
jgi:hypothetical protein